MKRSLFALSCWLLAPAAFAILDTNNNDVSDFWERDFNDGSLFDGYFDLQADPDKDGWSNALEAAAGTNPFDPNPPDGLVRPEIIHTPAVWGEENGVPYIDTPEAVTVTWPTIPGKRYRLLISPDLSQGGWIEVPDSAFIGNGNIPQFHFTTGESDKLFWRVAVEDAESDGDGLTDHEEHLAGTNPYLTDSDGDTIPDLDEIISGSDPAQTDEDGDGVTNSQEIINGTNHQDGDDYPLHLITVERLGYERGLTAVPQGGQGWAFGFAAGWTPDETFSFDGVLFDLEHLVQEIEKIEYPEIPGDASDGFLRSMELYAGNLSGGRNWGEISEATIRQNAVWLAGPPQPDLREYHFLNITKKTNYTDANSTPSYEVDPVTIQIQPNEAYSERYEMSPLPEIVANSETGAYSQLLTAEFIPSNNADVSADDHLIHLVLKIGDGSNMAEGSTLEWRIDNGPGGPSALAESTLSDGFSTVSLPTSTHKGDAYIVKARIKRLGYDQVDLGEDSPWLFCPEVRVIAGKPHTFDFTTTKSSYRSDGTDTSEITATIKDQYDNLVEDDTPVSWSVGQSPTSPFVSRDEVTVGGIAKAVLQAPLIPDDQVVACSAGDKEDTVTVAVQSVTGSISGNLDLNIGTGQQSTITVNAQAADGTPVYWTSSNGEITAQSAISGGVATATLSAASGRLGTVVVTATVGDHLFFSQGAFISSAGLAIGADHPVLIAGATADGVHTPDYPHGLARSIPYYAGTPVRIKGPPNSVVNLNLQASLPLASWAFDPAEGNVSPSGDGIHAMTLANASIDESIRYSGVGSLALQGTGSGSIPDSSAFHFTEQFNASIRLRPSQHHAATLAAKAGSWQIGQLADGRIQASVVTGTGTYSTTTDASVPLGQWTWLEVDFRFNRLRIKLDDRTSSQVATIGTLLVTTNPIEVGTGFHGNLDSLELKAGGSASSRVTATGLGAGDTLQLDASGEGVFAITSTGDADAGDTIHLSASVAAGEPEGGSYSAALSSPLDDPEVAEAIVDFAEAVHWDAAYDTVMSFIGGDPQTTQGTVASIAGGVCVVGDVGSCAKNLWRIAGWSDTDPNYVELGLGGLGVITTFADVTGVGAAADAGIASIKTLAIRFVGNAKAEKFLDVLILQLKNAAVGSGSFGWAEANFLNKMVLDIPVADAFKLFLHDEALAKAAIRATEKLGANAESFYQATRRAVASHGEETAKKFVQVFEGLGDEALTALKNAPAGELDEALEGLAKVANKGIAPFSLKRVLDNPNLYGTAYKRTNLLKDLGVLAEVPGMNLLVDALKSANNKGFRYELEGAAWLARNEKEVVELTKRIDGTDIDVVVLEGTKRIYYQFKRSNKAFYSGSKNTSEALDLAKAWVAKALKDLGDDASYDQIRYATDAAVTVPKKILEWLNSLEPKIFVERIPHLD